MKTTDIIKKTVFKFIEKNELFTSLDISQDIKTRGKFVRNVTVRNWLKANFEGYIQEADSCNVLSDPKLPHNFKNYETCAIQVRGGQEHATLYKPTGTLESGYVSRDQVPLAPSEVRKAAITNKPTPTDLSGTKKVPDISELMDAEVTVVSKSIFSTERLKIPKGITRILGWRAGTLIDVNKAKLIKTDKPLPKGLKVNKDLRISIPRGAVSIPNPVKVRCDGYVITFEKA